MKHYFFNGHEFSRIPDPITLKNGSNVSPVTEAVFRALGGTITDDGLPTPQERVSSELNSALAELADQVPGVTIAEFKEAARTLYSAGLIAWAKSKGVPDTVIDAARSRIVEIMADALRIGMNWAELISGIEE